MRSGEDSIPIYLKKIVLDFNNIKSKWMTYTIS